MPTSVPNFKFLTPLVTFLKNFVSCVSQGFVGQSSPDVAYVVEKPFVRNKLFSDYNILPRSGVRAECLRTWSENMQHFVTFFAHPVVQG